MTEAEKHAAHRPRLVYADKPVPHRWGWPPLSEVGEKERGLREMCDFGADQFKRGKTDLLAFDCMPAEVDFIRAYMAERHPGVGFTFGVDHDFIRRLSLSYP
jgi:hypothetical protein